MAKRIQQIEGSYDPVSQKFLSELASPALPTESAPVKPAPGVPSVPLKQRAREKRVLVDAEEDVCVEALVARLAAELGTPLKLSHVLRAFLTLLRRGEPYLLARARQLGPLNRPPNGDPDALARFEEQIAALLGAALRDMASRP